jgi:hypothetical protein
MCPAFQAHRQAIPSFALAFAMVFRYGFSQRGDLMKRLLPCLWILLATLLLGIGCATNSGGGSQSPATTANSSSSPTSPPGEVYTQPVAVPPATP